jgi:hypothetical protein
MAGAFEIATRAAIAEIIQAHAQPSKFGYVLSQEGFETLTRELYDLLVTSRNLKAAGDRFIQGGPAPAARTGATQRPKR